MCVSYVPGYLYKPGHLWGACWFFPIQPWQASAYHAAVFLWQAFVDDKPRHRPPWCNMWALVPTTPENPPTAEHWSTVRQTAGAVGRTRSTTVVSHFMTRAMRR